MYSNADQELPNDISIRGSETLLIGYEAVSLGKCVLLYIAVILIAVLPCGCSQLTPDLNSTSVFPIADTGAITGHIYLDGIAISGAHFEAISADGVDRRNTTTGPDGGYTLSIKPGTTYNITAASQGLRHTVWPVYLPGDDRTYDITLTAVPRSTIEGSGYAWGGHNLRPGDHQIWSDVVINLTSVENNATLTALTDREGRYVLEVSPNVPYVIDGAACPQNKYPMPIFHYRSTNSYLGMGQQIRAGENETILIDYELRLP